MYHLELYRHLTQYKRQLLLRVLLSHGVVLDSLIDDGLLLRLLLLAGLGLAAILGWITTRRAGTPLAMISLGLGELVWAVAVMWPQGSGGEGGLIEGDWGVASDQDVHGEKEEVRK